ncbi:HAD-like domain-containing protein [Halteromyces radiatus]|uniref:HAD-like domain-containing protein n=1 Tax=Halteromyces radiatus TaxID=101107 RepID=UPI00221F2E40|nr:HAD-like domain-containing protein [Halteromyces radiatus]KAI8093444.1 HAD-like domain-containing protein [Halteromyces radiatus]
MKNASRIKLITFDAYNTLFRPKGSLSAQYAHEASKVGIQVSPESITQHFGKAYRKQLQKSPFYGIGQGMTTEQWWKELVYATFLEAGVRQKDMDRHFPKLFKSLYTRFRTKEGYSIFPDVIGTLQELQNRGIRMGVISNSDERLLSVMESLQLEKYFDFILPSCLAGHEKPRPEIFQKALHLTDQDIHVDEALHVGDDLEKDYFGAVSAGWHGVLLKRSKLSYEDCSPSILAPMTNRRSPRNIMSLNDLYPLACYIRPLDEPEQVNEPLQASDHQ